MKSLFTICLTLFVSVSLFAQTPEGFKYQAVLRDGSGNVMASVSKTIKVDLVQGSVAGIVSFSEEHNAETNAQGLIIITIGSVKPTDFSAINWANGPYFIRISVDGAELGTSQILSVPYALYARHVEGITSSDINKWNAKSDFSGNYKDLTSKPDSASFVYIGNSQTITGKKIFSDTLNLNNKPLINVSNPKNSQDAATKNYVDRLLRRIELLEKHTGLVVTDYDGNKYPVVAIGTQEWMGENLKTIHFRNGEPISLETYFGNWASKTTSAYCFYDNEIANKDTFGLLYNYFTVVDSRNICPSGFHVPTYDEWTTLIDFLGSNTVAGGKLKATGTAIWKSPNAGATDDYGFSALPGGKRYGTGGAFGTIHSVGSWWTATPYSASNAYYIDTYYDQPVTFRNNDLKTTGFSIRCIKD